MKLRSLFLKIGVFVLPVFGALCLSGETFALSKNRFHNRESHRSYADKFDEKIKDMNKQITELKKERKKVAKLRKKLEKDFYSKKFKLKDLEEKLNSEKFEVFKNLTISDGCNFVFDDVIVNDGSLGEWGRKVGEWGRKVGISVERDVKKIIENFPDKVKQLLKSERPAIVVLDEKNNIKFEKDLTKEDIQKIKEDSKNSSLVDVVNKILAMKGFNENVSDLKKYGYTIVFHSDKIDSFICLFNNKFGGCSCIVSGFNFNFFTEGDFCITNHSNAGKQISYHFF